MEEWGHEYEELLMDWGQYPDPPGFGENLAGGLLQTEGGTEV